MIRPSLADALGHRVDRAGDGHDAGGEPEHLERGDDVAVPRRALRHDAVEQVDLREPHGGGPPPAEHADVGHGEGGDADEQPQPFRVQEVHGSSWRAGFWGANECARGFASFIGAGPGR